MEQQKAPVIAKRLWNVVRVALFMLRKGLASKRKLTADLDAMLKRGKSLMFHHHHHHHGRRRVPAPRDYEFSCSNTPAYSFPFKKKHHYLQDDEAAVAARYVFDLLNNCDGDTITAPLTPFLPGFGRTPLARPLRITDSPFPLRDDNDDGGLVDRAAEEFIQRFYNHLKKQNDGI